MSAPAVDPPSEAPLRRVAPGAPVIATVARLAEALHRERIRYCHWKSNAHLDESAAGTTDLDLLVDRVDAPRLAALLPRLGFRRFAAVPWHAYPGIEDHLALDRPTGRLVHVHLHHELTLGERHLKGYRLPWETLVLSTRRLDEATGLYVAEPTVELLLLIVRGALKLRLRDALPPWRNGGGLEPGAQREYHWLVTRANLAELSALTHRLLGPDAAEVVGTLGAEEPSRAWLRRFRRCARAELAGCRTHSAAGARVRRAAREARALVGAVDRRWIRSPHPRMRTSPRGGIVVALVGCDGSGKSTLLSSTVAWLAWKLDVMPLYLGSGDGPASPLRWPLRLALRLVLAARRRRARGGGAAQAPPAPSPRWTAARVVWALVLSREKRRKLRRAVRARNRGLVVVCDRYPQAQIPGFNDGPLLSRWLEHPWNGARAVARWEAAPYEWAARHPPDLVIKLLVSPEVTLRRKPGMRVEDVRRRIDAVRRLDFAEPAQVVEVDADAPLERVLLQVKEAVWARL